MAKAARVEAARMVFAKVTGALEDAALVAAEGQTAVDLAAARQTCDRLLAQMEALLEQLHRLRRRHG
jgi:hypothetical protein